MRLLTQPRCLHSSNCKKFVAIVFISDASQRRDDNGWQRKAKTQINQQEILYSRRQSLFISKSLINSILTISLIRISHVKNSLINKHNVKT